ncbi:MAG: tetratricopeptide repeat protein [Gemmatimonadetes bacterium]|nr:MAG: tetratricopeptide repeat protein [Gemmatimonadota bacterium]
MNLSSKIHQLEEVLPHAEGEERLNLLLELGQLVYPTQPERALKIGLEALTLAQNLQLVIPEAMALRLIGIGYAGQFANDRAIEFFLKSLSLDEKHNNLQGMVSAYVNLGKAYQMQQDYHTSLEFLEKALQIQMKLDDPRLLPHIYRNLGVTYQSLGDYDRALEYFQKELNLQEHLDSAESLATLFNNIGALYALKGDYDVGLDYQLKALEIWQQQGNQQGIAMCYINLGSGCRIQGKFEQALEYLHWGLDLAKKTGAKNWERIAYNNLFLLQETLENYREALEYHKHLLALEQELFNLEKNRHITSIELQYKTEKREREAEIYRLKNVELASALERLRRLNAEKNDFLEIVSHDLKNPLSYLIGISDLVTSYSVNTFSKEDLLAYFPRIRRTANRMLNLVTNLLDVNRLENGDVQFTLEPVNMQLVVLEVLSNYNAAADSKKIMLEFESPVHTLYAYADKSAVDQVLDNLISNAIKYSYGGTRVCIELLDRDDYIRCTVRDQGQGLSEADLQQVFTKYTRLSAQPTDGEHSSGLGLSIVKRLVDEMNGTVWVESEGPEKGATFGFDLPKAVSS